MGFHIGNIERISLYYWKAAVFKPCLSGAEAVFKRWVKLAGLFFLLNI